MRYMALFNSPRAHQRGVTEVKWLAQEWSNNRLLAFIRPITDTFLWLPFSRNCLPLIKPTPKPIFWLCVTACDHSCIFIWFGVLMLLLLLLLLLLLQMKRLKWCCRENATGALYKREKLVNGGVVVVASIPTSFLRYGQQPLGVTLSRCTNI